MNIDEVVSGKLMTKVCEYVWMSEKIKLTVPFSSTNSPTLSRTQPPETGLERGGLAVRSLASVWSLQAVDDLGTMSVVKVQCSCKTRGGSRGTVNTRLRCAARFILHRLQEARYKYSVSTPVPLFSFVPSLRSAAPVIRAG